MNKVIKLTLVGLCCFLLSNTWAMAEGNNGKTQTQQTQTTELVADKTVSTTAAATAAKKPTKTSEKNVPKAVDGYIKDCNIEIAFEYEVEDLTVNFVNASVGNYDDLTWDFGDQNKSTNKAPTHTYTKGGQYTFCLSASNKTAQCKETFCGQIYIFD